MFAGLMAAFDPFRTLALNRCIWLSSMTRPAISAPLWRPASFAFAS